MSDDLVKRLRDPRYDGQLMMRASAADRIEQLEEFLRIHDAYLVDRGLWEDFCESVEETDD